MYVVNFEYQFNRIHFNYLAARFVQKCINETKYKENLHIFDTETGSCEASSVILLRTVRNYGNFLGCFRKQNDLLLYLCLVLHGTILLEGARGQSRFFFKCNDMKFCNIEFSLKNAHSNVFP